MFGLSKKYKAECVVPPVVVVLGLQERVSASRMKTRNTNRELCIKALYTYVHFNISIFSMTVLQGLPRQSHCTNTSIGPYASIRYP